ncbi:unnamed protein product [Toxocara canis]|uniref:G_PROTEIN_RECEP_F1_2 domain-containing protein n=1 Tax=Toxocara canis TaxID=6265 RepID=A0A183UVP2_TOXCA|nr:unnamed protein product [Toxocara canis]
MTDPLQPIILCDQFTFTAVPIMLMANSIDRLIAVTYPIMYFMHTLKCILVQIFVAYAFILITLAITFVWAITDDSGSSTVLCTKSDYLPSELHTFLVMIRVGTAMGSIVAMGVVLFKLKAHSIRVAELRHETQMSIFIKRQKSFTKAMLISCCFTFALFVIPSCVALYARIAMLTRMDDVTMYTRFVTFFNSMNMVAIVVLRQDDIKQQLLKAVHYDSEPGLTLLQDERLRRTSGHQVTNNFIREKIAQRSIENAAECRQE